MIYDDSSTLAERNLEIGAVLLQRIWSDAVSCVCGEKLIRSPGR